MERERISDFAYKGKNSVLQKGSQTMKTESTTGDLISSINMSSSEQVGMDYGHLLRYTEYIYWSLLTYTELHCKSTFTEFNWHTVHYRTFVPLPAKTLTSKEKASPSARYASQDSYPLDISHHSFIYCRKIKTNVQVKTLVSTRLKTQAPPPTHPPPSLTPPLPPPFQTPPLTTPLPPPFQTPPPPSPVPPLLLISLHKGQISEWVENSPISVLYNIQTLYYYQGVICCQWLMIID